jgi:hypothetical protein
VSRDDFEDADEIHEALGEILLEISNPGTTDEDVRSE